MVDENLTPASPASPSTDRERDPTELPAQVTEQPDPMLQMSTGRMGAGGVTLVAIAIAAIIGLVLWGLNSRAPTEHTVAAPPAAGGTATPGGS